MTAKQIIEMMEKMSEELQKTGECDGVEALPEYWHDGGDVVVFLDDFISAIERKR